MACAAALAVGLVVPAAGLATNYTVTNPFGSGPGTLPQAVHDANASGGPDTISFAPGLDQVFVTDGQLQITGNLTINGPGSDKLAVFGGNPGPTARIFLIDDSADVTIEGLTIRGARVRTGGDQDAVGGGILNRGTLTLQDSLVGYNTAEAVGETNDAAGGGISNSGTLSLVHTTVFNNQALSSRGDGDVVGGGIRNSGTLIASDSVIDQNLVVGWGSDARGDGRGAGIANLENGQLAMDSSTLSRNTATGGQSGGAGTGEGGALYARGPVTLENSTVSDNGAFRQGGLEGFGAGIFVAGPVNLTGVTLSNNFARRGANLYGFGVQPRLKNTIVANPQGGGQNCGDLVVESLGYNLESANSCDLREPSDQHGVDPKLGPLQNNGGPTPTRAIPISSPAVDQGISAGLNTDQRGDKRPVRFPDIPLPAGGDGSDVGAFELQAGLGGNHRQIHGSVDPDRAPAGERTCLHFNARKPNGDPLAHVEVHLGGKVQDTGRHGGATICKRFDRAGDRHARLKKPTWETDRLKIRIFE